MRHPRVDGISHWTWYQLRYLSAHSDRSLPLLLIWDRIHSRERQDTGVDDWRNQAHKKVHWGDISVVTQLHNVLNIWVLYNRDFVRNTESSIREPWWCLQMVTRRRQDSLFKLSIQKRYKYWGLDLAWHSVNLHKVPVDGMACAIFFFFFLPESSNPRKVLSVALKREYVTPLPLVGPITPENMNVTRADAASSWDMLLCSAIMMWFYV